MVVHCPGGVEGAFTCGWERKPNYCSKDMYGNTTSSA